MTQLTPDNIPPIPDSDTVPGSPNAQLADQLRIAERELGCAESEIEDAQALILREYFYHRLRAEELKDWLRKAGIETDNL